MSKKWDSALTRLGHVVYPIFGQVGHPIFGQVSYPIFGRVT